MSEKEEKARADRQPDLEHGYSRLRYAETDEGKQAVFAQAYPSIVRQRLSLDDVIRMNGGRLR